MAGGTSREETQLPPPPSGTNTVRRQGLCGCVDCSDLALPLPPNTEMPGETTEIPAYMALRRWGEQETPPERTGRQPHAHLGQGIHAMSSVPGALRPKALLRGHTPGLEEEGLDYNAARKLCLFYLRIHVANYRSSFQVRSPR